MKQKTPLFILFLHLGLGGVERKIVDIANLLAESQPDLPIYILLRKKTGFDSTKKIKNKRVRIINYLDWTKIRKPYFFPLFVFYHVWKLKPQAILAFLDFCSITAVWAKLFFFWRRIKVVLSEDHYASQIIALQRFAWLRHLSVRIFYPFADKIFSCTQATKKDLMVSYKIPEEKIRIIRNWTSFIGKKIIKTPKKYDLIYVGRLDRTKNVIFLLRGIQKLRENKANIRLCIVGEGEEAKYLKKFARDNQLEKNIDFVGACYQVEKLLNQSKIFVFSPKRKVEGFPLTILEAMAFGLVVLTSKFDGVKEVIESGVNGFIFDSMSDFMKKILWLLGNPSKRLAVGLKAREYVKQRHAPENIKDYLKELGLLKE